MMSIWLKAMFITLMILLVIVMTPKIFNDLPMYITEDYVRTAIELMFLAVIIFFILMTIIKF